MTPRRLGLALLAFLLIAGGPVAAADRHRSVGDWRVEEVDAADGGRLVRMRRSGRGYALEYHVLIWRRNAAQLRGATLRYRDCRNGERDMLQDPEAEVTADMVRDQIGAYLAECRVPAVAAAPLLAGFDPAFAQLTAWVAETAARLAAGPDGRDATLGVPSDLGRGMRECAGLTGIHRAATGALLDLHQAPDPQSAVVGRMPDAASFTIRATFDGWLEIDIPADEDRLRATGWLPGRGVSMQSNAAAAHAFPRESSQVVLRSRDGAPLLDHGAIEDVIACDGDWVLGRWTFEAADRVEHVAGFRTWPDPLRVEAWVPGFRSMLPARADLRRDLGGWRVESIADEEAGRLTRLTRQGEDFAIEYYASFWHGNAGPYFGASVTRPGRACGGESWHRDPDGLVWAPEADVVAGGRDLRARLTEYLAACGSTPAEIASALAGLEPAFALAAEWAEQDRRLVLAVSRAIADYGAVDEGQADPQ